MTHAIGRGTQNCAVNLALEEKRVLGRLAFEADRSCGNLIRRLILAGLERENPEAAAKVREIRRRYYGASLLALALLASVQAVTGDAQPMRRPAAMVRVVRREWS